MADYNAVEAVANGGSRSDKDSANVLATARHRMTMAVAAYSEEVRSGKFPDEDHTFHLEK